VYSGRYWPMFQRSLLPPSSGYSRQGFKRTQANIWSKVRWTISETDRPTSAQWCSRTFNFAKNNGPHIYTEIFASGSLRLWTETIPAFIIGNAWV
jgi:hypothetical protein